MVVEEAAAVEAAVVAAAAEAAAAEAAAAAAECLRSSAWRSRPGDGVALGDVEYVCGIGPNVTGYNLPLEPGVIVLAEPECVRRRQIRQPVRAGRERHRRSCRLRVPTVTGANEAVEAFNCPGPPFGPLES